MLYLPYRTATLNSYILSSCSARKHIIIKNGWINNTSPWTRKWNNGKHLSLERMVVSWWNSNVVMTFQQVMWVHMSLASKSYINALIVSYTHVVCYTPSLPTLASFMAFSRSTGPSGSLWPYIKHNQSYITHYNNVYIYETNQ